MGGPGLVRLVLFVSCVDTYKDQGNVEVGDERVIVGGHVAVFQEGDATVSG